MKTQYCLASIALAAGSLSLSVFGTNIEISYENLNQDGGVWNTPLFLGFHDGSFDTADLGAAASMSVEMIAEEGDVSGLLGDIALVGDAKSAVLADDGSPGGAPPVLFNPGSGNSLVIDLDSTQNRYLSFASMILPSNDAFIGNLNPMAHELFNLAGEFNNSFVIDIFGIDVWDAGTENNDGMGAPFSAIGGSSTDTVGGVVSRHLDLPSGQNPGLSNFVGTGIGDGSVLQNGFGTGTHIGRLTARRVPDTAPAAGLISVLFLVGFQSFIRKRS